MATTALFSTLGFLAILGDKVWIDAQAARQIEVNTRRLDAIEVRGSPQMQAIIVRIEAMQRQLDDNAHRLERVEDLLQMHVADEKKKQ